ncbi:HlyD family efflux transporter periplasmic adaptor subunit [Trichocoleus sp. FACHB-262]|uniref:HlyD family efflux transporter periplasmic adaptor subunit n=1 Tax=Trichocoleus sp. FACHB-262 TaxID=2692869 RepID=UPI001683C291|nr:HlyD family efflux transporter periplasmic adaptor subunit [Trichocoleus sp. FACHB-262]MBD2124582.1 HlyD family efflux transporter periplasmic adaptor subunit [Trichocoleus sp. FACHB-262]
MNFQTLSKPANRGTLALIIAATAASGAIAFIGISQVKRPSQPTVVAETKAVPKVQRITALGRIEPATEVIKVSVPATLSNDRVAELRVQRGDRVEADQVIAVMDSQARLQNVLLEAQAQVKIAQAEVAKVKAGAKTGEIAAQEAEIARLEEQLEGELATQQATIARWQAEVQTANADYNRYLPLYGEGAIAATELDRRRLALQTAQAQLNEVKAKQSQSANTIREQIRQARANLNRIAEVRPVDVQAAQAQVDKAIAAVRKAESDLAEASIKAPISGRILDIDAKPGEVVGSAGIAELGQTNEMQVVAEVYQTDISQVQKGQPVAITSESFEGELKGTVSSVGLQVTQQEVTSGKPGENLDRKVVEVRIQIDPKDSQRVASLTNLQVQVAIQADSLANRQ